MSLLAASIVLAAPGCGGVAVKRDLSRIKPTEVVLDDLCGLQEYFDALKDATLAPPAETFTRDIESEAKGRALGGRKRFRFESQFQVHYLRRLLESNWKAVPMEIAKASQIELEVTWSERGGVSRVVTDEEALIAIGPKSWALPYHVCLSDFLFGASLYDTRRAMLQLPDPVPSRFSTTARAGSPPPSTREMSPLARPAFAAPPVPDPTTTATATSPGSPEPPASPPSSDVSRPASTSTKPATEEVSPD